MDNIENQQEPGFFKRTARAHVNRSQFVQSFCYNPQQFTIMWGLFLFLLLYLAFISAFRYGRATARGCRRGGELAFSIVEAALIIAFYTAMTLAPVVTTSDRVMWPMRTYVSPLWYFALAFLTAWFLVLLADAIFTAATCDPTVTWTDGLALLCLVPLVGNIFLQGDKENIGVDTKVDLEQPIMR